MNAPEAVLNLEGVGKSFREPVCDLWPFSRGAEDIGDQGFGKPAAREILEFSDDGRDGVDEAGAFGEGKAAEQTGGLETQVASDQPAEALIHQDGGRAKIEGEGERFGFAGVEMGRGESGGNVVRRADLEPCGQDRVIAAEFGLDGRRDEDFGKELLEQAGTPDFQERGERRSVADDEHGSATEGGAQFADGDEILGEFLPSVVHRDFAASEFAHEVELRHAGGFRGLAEGGFLGGEKTDGEMQGGPALGERGFERGRQGDVHGTMLAGLPTHRNAMRITKLWHR